MTGPVGDAISDFYEAHPYPPPPDDLDGEAIGWEDGTRRRTEHARLWPALPYRDDHEILIAGCGTYQAVRYGLRYPNARVVGIDVSRSSLESTERLARHYGLDNVHVSLTPVERAVDLGQRFDHVVSTGVVHHLADPATGLAALRDTMTPTGALNLMVYGLHGRRGITMIRHYCQMLGVEPTPAEIADLVATLSELPAGHPVSDVLRRSPDFRNADALADALLNPREQAFDVVGVHDLVRSAGLRFARWFRQAPYLPSCGSVAETPHAARIQALVPEQQHAAMELFRGTMARHSVVAHRDDAPRPMATIPWEGASWSRLVPHRPHTVVAVKDRLPTGVAAALINRAHTDRDLVFFADPATLEAFGQVDGKTPLGEVNGATPDMFRSLWEHDLVMVDASDVT